MKIFIKILLWLLFILLILPGSFQAQDGPAVYEIKSSEIDPLTGDLKVTTKIMEIGENHTKDTLTVYFLKRRIKDPTIGYRYYLSIFSTLDLGCSGTSDNYIKIKFENGDIFKLEKDISKINCKRPAESIYELGGEILEKLKTKNIESIKLKQSKYYSEFTIWYPDFFIKSIRLLGKYI